MNILTILNNTYHAIMLLYYYNIFYSLKCYWLVLLLFYVVYEFLKNYVQNEVQWTFREVIFDYMSFIINSFVKNNTNIFKTSFGIVYLLRYF